MYFPILLLFAIRSCTAGRPDIGNIDDTGGYNNGAEASISVLLDQGEQRNDLTDTDTLDILDTHRTDTLDILDTRSTDTLGLLDTRRIDTLDILDTRRRKRSDTAFDTVWQTLVKSTIGFAWLEIRGSDAKVFAKVGTAVDATNEFYSLVPITTVTKLATGSLLGFVKNHSIVLNVNGDRPMIYVLKDNSTTVEKVIHYYENWWKARVALSQWKVYSNAQKLSVQ